MMNCAGRVLLLAFPVAVSACAIGDLGPNPYVQPQATNADVCTVKPFFVESLRSVPAEVKVENNGQTCAISMFNSNLGRVQDAAFVTQKPAHAQVWTKVYGGDRGTVIVFYKPAPGYTGPDQFNVTFEPEARDVIFDVVVSAPAPKPL